MAEGHLVAHWADCLQPMVRERLELVEAPQKWAKRTAELIGEHLVSVESHGKHLLLHFSTGHTINCHAMMYGSWQFGRPGMRLRKPESRVRLRLRTHDREAVFFNGPVVEVLTQEELEGHPRLSALGPDVLSPDFDRRAAWRRLRAEPEREIADALLDQTIVAGIGNIYKAEGLFLAKIDPRRPAASIGRRDAERIWDAVIGLMAEGVRASGDTATLPPGLRGPGQRNWVYQRRGRPCFECGSSIQMVRQGQHQRSTYFCPECQG